MNYDVMDNDVEGIKVMFEGLLFCGVILFLLIILILSKECLIDVVCMIG